MSSRRLLVLAGALFLGAGLVLADTHPNTDRGFAPERAFLIGDIDNVNTFNGNLAITIPIGGTYPVDGGLSYGLTLVYNSNLWEFQEREDSISGQTFSQGRAQFGNTGLGWRLSMGGLFPRATNPLATGLGGYTGPDGNTHIFYAKLHEGDGEDPEDGGLGPQKVAYTRDGSYLRLFDRGTDKREVEFPDGTIHTFDDLGRVIEIRTRFKLANQQPAAWVRVSYGTGLWTVTDSLNRTHTVSLSARVQDGLSQESVDRVDLQAFGGQTASYLFSYSGATAIGRAAPHNDPAMAPQANVIFLTGITLPDASSYSIPVSSYETSVATGAPNSRSSGAIRRLRLPTLGYLEWDFQDYSFSTESGKPFRRFSSGVAKRRMKDPNGTTVLGEWIYSTALSPATEFSPLPVFEELINEVRDPLGHRTRRYFSVRATNGGAQFSEYDYSLPFTKKVSDGAGRYLAVEVLDASNVLLRSTYVRYEADQRASPIPGDLQDRIALNRREASTRTVYNDDGNRTVDLGRSNFDGLGHYRQTVTTSSFGGGDTPHTSFVGYLPSVGTYALDGTGVVQPGFTMIPSSGSWILTILGDRYDSEGAFTQRDTSCFDPSTGFLKRRRTHRNPGSWSGNDLLAEYTPDVAGNVVRESYFGGDGAALSTTDTCSFALPGASYQVDHTYQAGVRATSRYLNASFNSLDRTIDARSGLPSASKDTAGLTTTYTYDTLGRLLWSQPPVLGGAGGDGWTEYVYSPAATPSALANVVIRRRGNGSQSAPVLSQGQVFFDGFGRLARESQRLPGGVTNARDTAYNSAGLKESVSEVQTGTPAKKMEYRDYDPFARPTTIRPPDGSVHDISLRYFGSRVVERTVSIGTSYNSGTQTVTEAPAKTTETYDHQGRLLKVTEPSGATGAQVTTSYSYDAGNRLTGVSTPATVSGSLVTQTRSFVYDSLGLLRSEAHPEKGAFGNGTVTYSQYDARGHARRKVDGQNDLTYTFDGSERLTLVRETATGTALKDFTYGTSNPGGDYRNGKLTQSNRYNYVTVGTTNFAVQMSEKYFYLGRQGRLSQRDTSATTNGTLGESFRAWFYFDPLGNMSSTDYPQCTNSGCAGSAASPRTITYAYSEGLLTAVTGATFPGTQTYASSINYHPNLMVNQVTHGNSVVDTYALDANAMRRPLSITATQGASTRWSTGSYSYDGVGNITKVGSSWFTYDPVSRITTGTVFDGPTGSGAQKQQTYAFDPFGNLTNIGGSPGRALPTTAGTNHLNNTNYDQAGNVTSWNGAAYAFDRFNQMFRFQSGAEDNIYLYNADDERIWTYSVPQNVSHWTLRDPAGKVLRDYLNNNNIWSVSEDYVYRDGQLLAAEIPGTGVRHFSLDHLGTPRLITNSAGAQVAYHVYFPFGEEATLAGQDAERMKFTGHERDLNNLGSTADDLDYMHARHFGPLTGRFLGMDRAGSWQPAAPQTWNRYTYVLNNPLRLVDPTGQAAQEPGLLDRLVSFFSDLIERNAPAPNSPVDPSAQALVEEGELSPSQAARMSPGRDATLTQRGLIQASSLLAGTAVFTGLKAGEAMFVAETLNGFRVGASVLLKSGTLDVNVFALKQVSGGNLRGLLGTFEREAARLGADKVVVRGALAKDFFKSAKAAAVARKLGYSFRLLDDGTLYLSKSLAK